MIDLIRGLFYLPDSATEQERNAFRAASIVGVATTVAAIFYIFLAWRLDIPQLYFMAGNTILIIIASVITAVLCRRNRSNLGGGILVGVLAVMMPAFSLIVAELGLVIGISTAVIISTVASQSLIRKWVAPSIILGYVAGASTLLLDIFGSDSRLNIPVLQAFIPVLAASVILAYFYFLVRQYANYTLRTKLSLAILVVALIPLSTLIFFSNNSTQELLIEEANLVLLSNAKQTATAMDAFIETNLTIISAQARASDVITFAQASEALRRTPAVEDSIREALEFLAERDEEFISSYALLDTNGKNIFDTALTGSGQDESYLNYFLEPMKTGQPYVSPIRIEQSGILSNIYFSSPVTDGNGNLLGVLRLRYRGTVLQDIIKTSLEEAQESGVASKRAFAILVNTNQVQMANTLNTRQILKRSDMSATSVGLAAAETDSPYFEANFDGVEEGVSSAAIVTLKHQPWHLIYAKPQATFLNAVTRQTQVFILLAVGVSGLMSAAAFGVGNFLAGPILRITAVAQRVADGFLDEQAPVEYRDETGKLAMAFNSMTTQLRSLIGSLEDQVKDRTAELTLSLEVGQRASEIRDLNELLPTITEFIRERFNLYYVQVYFTDDLRQMLVLRAGTGVAGQELLSINHRLAIGGRSIVGYAANNAKPMVVSDTENSDIHKPNPRLPNTRSELAVPLIVEGEVIGVLDLQASETNIFTEANLPVFEAMSVQLANSIDSAQQWNIAQTAQQRSEQIIRQFTRENWTATLEAYTRHKQMGFTYNLSNVAPLELVSQHKLAGTEQTELEVSAPLTVQNETIGRLAIEVPNEHHWSRDDEGFLNSIAQQLAQKAETLRLFEETQQQATREQITRQITDKIRASTNIETALNTAVQELREALGVSRAAIDLNVVADIDGETTEKEEQI